MLFIAATRSFPGVMALRYVVYFRFCGWRRVLTQWPIWCVVCVRRRRGGYSRNYRIDSEQILLNVKRFANTKKEKKVKEAYSSLCYKHSTATGTHVPYGITHSRLYTSQLRLVLDLATPDGCKAELCAGVEVCYVRLSCCQVVMDTKLISSQTRAEARRTTVGVKFRYN